MFALFLYAAALAQDASLLALAPVAPGTEDQLVASLMAAPPGTPLPEFVHQQWRRLRPHVVHWTIADELMDQRETSFLFAGGNGPLNNQQDFDIVRKRRLCLAGMPRTCFCHGLPPRPILEAAIARNREYRRQWVAAAAINTDRRCYCQEMIDEIDRRYKILDAARDATCDFYYITTRREAIKKVIQYMGSDVAACGLPLE